MREKTETEIVQQALVALPEEQALLNDEFLSLASRDIFQIIHNGLVDNPIQKPKPKEGVTRFQDVLKELDKLKNQLGGAPTFGYKTPSINDNDNTKTYFGIPLAAIKDWLIMTQRKEWEPQFFWSKLGALFGATKNGMSQYEEAHIRIQKFGLLIDNKDYFTDVLNRADTEHYIDLVKITGLAWHPSQNSPGTEKEYIEFIEHFLTDYFEDAKAKGEQALIDYFNAFEGVCFEERARYLEQYVITHPLANEPILDINQVADWTSANSCEDVFMKEATLLANDLKTQPNPSQLLEYITRKGIFDIEFAVSDGEKRKPTQALYREWASAQVELDILAEDDESDSRHMSM